MLLKSTEITSNSKPITDKNAERRKTSLPEV